MKVINKSLLNNVSAQAKTNARLRMNYNLHDSVDDPVNRLLNAMEPDTYIRPHRHTLPPKSESLIVLQGEIAAIIFDDNGNIKQTEIINPAKGVFGIDIAPHEWHMFIVLQSDTVIYEVKTGPYTPIAECDWAPWSPPVNNLENVKQYIQQTSNRIQP